MRMRKEFGFWWFLSSTLLGSISICWFNKKSVTGTYQLFILDSFKGQEDGEKAYVCAYFRLTGTYELSLLCFLYQCMLLLSRGLPPASIIQSLKKPNQRQVARPHGKPFKPSFMFMAQVSIYRPIYFPFIVNAVLVIFLLCAES